MSAVLQPVQCGGALSVREPLFSGGVRLAGWFLFESHLDGLLSTRLRLVRVVVYLAGLFSPAVWASRSRSGVAGGPAGVSGMVLRFVL